MCKDKTVKIKSTRIEYCMKCGWIDWFNVICKCGNDKRFILKKKSELKKFNHKKVFI